MENIIKCINEQGTKHNTDMVDFLTELNTNIFKLATLRFVETESMSQFIHLKSLGIIKEFISIPLRVLVQYQLRNGFKETLPSKIDNGDITEIYKFVQNGVLAKLLLNEEVVLYSLNGQSLPVDEYFYFVVKIGKQLVFIVNDLISFDEKYFLDKIKNVDNSINLKELNLIGLNLLVDYEVRVWKKSDVLKDTNTFIVEKFPYVSTLNCFLEDYSFSQVNATLGEHFETTIVRISTPLHLNDFKKVQIQGALKESTLKQRDYLDSTGSRLKEFGEEYPDIIYRGDVDKTFAFASLVASRHEEYTRLANGGFTNYLFSLNRGYTTVVAYIDIVY